LRPERTHSLESKLMARAGRHEADVTAYYQRTRDLRSDLVELEGDVLVSRPVNLGTRTSLGTSLILRGPVAKGVRYALTTYLARDRIEHSDLPGVDDDGTRYGSSIQLEYRDGTEGRAAADHVRLIARYTGPIENGLSRTSSTILADASWSHGLTDRLAAVLTASHVLKSPTISSFGPEVITRTRLRSSGPSFNLALTYSLSAAGQ
jgi:hypothetical protein